MNDEQHCDHQPGEVREGPGLGSAGHDDSCRPGATSQPTQGTPLPCDPLHGLGQQSIRGKLKEFGLNQESARGKFKELHDRIVKGSILFRDRFGELPDFFIVSVNLLDLAVIDPDIEYIMRRMVRTDGSHRYEICGFPLGMLLEQDDIVLPVKRGILDSDFNAESKVAPA